MKTYQLNAMKEQGYKVEECQSTIVIVTINGVEQRHYLGSLHSVMKARPNERPEAATIDGVFNCAVFPVIYPWTERAADALTKAVTGIVQPRDGHRFISTTHAKKTFDHAVAIEAARCKAEGIPFDADEFRKEFKYRWVAITEPNPTLVRTERLRDAVRNILLNKSKKEADQRSRKALAPSAPRIISLDGGPF